MAASPVLAAGLNDPDEPPTARTVALTAGAPVPFTTAALELVELTSTGALLSVRSPEFTQKASEPVGSVTRIGKEEAEPPSQEATARTVIELLPWTTRLLLVKFSSTSTE